MKHPAALLIFAALCGCATTTPQTESYALGFDLPASGQQHLVVTVSDYLRSDRLVVQTASHQMRRAQFHRWIEPLEQGVARVIASEVDAPGEQTLVHIETLHGHTNGQVTLMATATLKTCSELRLRETMQQDGRGYAQMVAAQEALLLRLAGAIADGWQSCGRS